MTTGDAIIWSTVLILGFVTVWRVSANQSWKKILKIFGVLSLLFATIAVGAEIYKWLDQRPKKITGLKDIELGMSEAEVLVNLGEPIERNEQETYFTIYYERSYDPDYKFSLSIDKKSKKVNLICEEGEFTDPYLNKYSSENDIEERFGKAENSFLNPDGKYKSLSYPMYNITFLFSKRKLLRLCVAEKASGYLA